MFKIKCTVDIASAIYRKRNLSECWSKLYILVLILKSYVTIVAGHKELTSAVVKKKKKKSSSSLG